MAGRQDHLGSGKQAGPPLQGEGVGFGRYHLCGAKGLPGSLFRGGGRGSLSGGTTCVEPGDSSDGTTGRSKGARLGSPTQSQGQSAGSPRVDPEVSLGRIVWSGPGASSERSTVGGQKQSGLRRPDLFLGDLGRDHSLPGEGETEAVGGAGAALPGATGQGRRAGGVGFGPPRR